MRRGSLLSASPFTVGNANNGADLGTYSKNQWWHTSALAGSVPTATATVTAHGWTSGNTVKIDGASPNVYNQTAAITVVNANTFTYVLPSCRGERGPAVGTNHNLVAETCRRYGSKPCRIHVTNARSRASTRTIRIHDERCVDDASAGHSVLGKKLVPARPE